MAFKLGPTDAANVYIGSMPASKVYIGTTEVWSAGSVAPSPFAHYDFHEGSGSTTSDIMGNMPDLNAYDAPTAWNGTAAAGEFNKDVGWTLPAPWTYHFDVDLATFSGTTYTYLGVFTDNNYMYITNSGAVLSFYSPGTGNIAAPNNSVAVGRQTLTWVSDGSAVYLYVNGTQVQSGAGASSSPVWMSIAQHGSWPTGDLMHSLKIWNVALADSQVAQL